MSKCLGWGERKRQRGSGEEEGGRSEGEKGERRGGS